MRLLIALLATVSLMAQTAPAPVTAVAFVLSADSAMFAGLSSKPDIEPQLLLWVTSPPATSTSRYEIDVKTSAGSTSIVLPAVAAPAWASAQLALAKGETLSSVDVSLVTVAGKTTAQVLK